ncbi:thiamine phosphate synthase [Desulfocapsa sp. AH-315-G09]|uniref:Thiamine-phosphate synthase n=1 Tax=Desulfotalea psychrophila TaxID=84980 RepID=A0ABS3ASC4_9BACT|nr:thiamine phosphate synthase [Desulfocapsa sp.]MBN4058614.1 thiamine phosphate synthase [Desulfocapsa sp. AH-315-J15]MBN4065209.1 thiamine phosphate synthase [Desulfocapsa sp. AH-315-G09]MBN4068023.1 thiamine phosphate synthase [Desulfotalea psychrophila]
MVRIAQGVANAQLYAKRLKQFEDEVGVYPVSCEQLAAGRSDIEWLDQVIAGGAKIVQLRDKESTDRELLAKARYFRKKTSEAGVLFFLNDRLDIALLADVDGMHVGQKDLPPDEIRKLAPDILIGFSCNTEEQTMELGREVEQQKSAVSYYNIGPLFKTGTKKGLYHFLGVDGIGDFARHCALPFTVMGGIKLHHLGELLAAGARRIAVVTAISQAGDIAKETADWQQRIVSAREGR